VEVRVGTLPTKLKRNEKIKIETFVLLLQQNKQKKKGEGGWVTRNSTLSTVWWRSNTYVQVWGER
jgi:hypothetical protein